MKINLNNIIPFLFLISGSYIVCLADTYQHENAHKQIMFHDGCSGVEIEINFALDGSYAICTDPDYIESDLAQMLHSQNEIVSYNLFTMMCCMVLCSIFIVLCGD